MASEAEEAAQRIFCFIQDALSTDAPKRQRAEAALREAEEERDFFASLASIAIASDDQAEAQVRWLASVCGKNAVSRSWRRRAKQNKVTEEERDFVRQQLLSGLGEKHSIISTQLSVWISNIARVDFPKSWPSLMTDLADAIRGNNQLVTMHALVTLDMVLKQLASRRLMSDRHSLYRVAPILSALLNDAFLMHLDYLGKGTGDGEGMAHSFNVVVRCMKSLRRLVSHGCQKLADLPQASGLLSKVVELPDVFMRGASGGTEFQLRLSLLAAKFVQVTHERHPLEFQPFLPSFLQLYYDTVVNFNSEVSCDRTSYRAALFLRNAAKCPFYEINGKTIADHQMLRTTSPSSEISPAASRFIVLSFFDEKRTTVLIEAMISKIFVLTKREIGNWSSDPEAIVREEEAAEWGTENLRYECEELFKLLLIRDKPRVVPMILKLAESVPRDKPLLLDACYRAVGKAVYDVQGSFKFDVWLNGQLRAILEADCSENLGDRIIQARTAWLVAQFTEQLTREARQVVSPLLLRMMSFMNKDRVIALTAAKAIRTLVEDLGFHAGDFGPHLERCLMLCFNLIHTSETFETKRDILSTVMCLVDRCASQYVLSMTRLIASALPQLWEETGTVTTPEWYAPSDAAIGDRDKIAGHDVSSGGENLLRTAIVTLLTSMISKGGSEAMQLEAMRKIIFPVIAFAVDLSPGRGGTFMMTEGCELWSAAVAASRDYTDEFRVLFPQVERILGVDFDSLREVFRLMEGYVLLGGESFMRDHGGVLVKTLRGVLRSLRDRGHLAAVEILDIVVQRFPQDGVRFTAEILRAVLSKGIARTQSQVVTAAFMCLLARATLVNIADTEALVLQSKEEACLSLLDTILDYVDAMYRLPRRKLAVLALAGITTRYHASEKVQMRVPGVLNAVVQILSEEENKRKRDASRTLGNDFENMLARYGEEAAAAELGDDVGDSKAVLPEEERRRALRESDIVEGADLRVACTEMVDALKRVGPEQYNAILSRVDGRVLEQLRQLLEQ